MKLRYFSSKLFFGISTIVVLVFVNLLNYMDRYTIAGILPELQSSRTNNFSVNLDDTEGGFLQTSFIIAFMLLSPIFGYFGDRYKRKYLIAFGLTLWSIFVLVGSFSVNYGMLVATRCFVGIGEASYATIAPTILADMFTVEKRIRVLSIFYMAIPIGSAMGYGIGSYVTKLANDINFCHVEGCWRWAFRVTPGLGILAVLLIVLLVKEPPRGLSEHKKCEGVQGQSGVKGYLNDVWYLIKVKSLVLSTFGFAASTFAIGALAQWAPTYIVRLSNLQVTHYTVPQASIGFGILTVISGIVGTVAGAELSKHLSHYTRKADCYVCAISLVLGAPLMYVALFTGQFNIYAGWVTVFIAEVCLCLNWAPVANLLLYVVVPERRSSAEALQILVIHLLGDAISPTIIGVISDHIHTELRKDHVEDYSVAIGMQYSLFLTAFICAIGGGFFLFASLFVDQDRLAVEKHTRTGPATIQQHDPLHSGHTFGESGSETEKLLTSKNKQLVDTDEEDSDDEKLTKELQNNLNANNHC